MKISRVFLHFSSSRENINASSQKVRNKSSQDWTEGKKLFVIREFINLEIMSESKYFSSFAFSYATCASPHLTEPTLFFRKIYFFFPNFFQRNFKCQILI